jgi:hypothetical protein
MQLACQPGAKFIFYYVKKTLAIWGGIIILIIKAHGHRKQKMNPYNHNPFKTDETRETRNEFDANRELAKSAKKDSLSETLLSIAHFADMPKDKTGFWK